MIGLENEADLPTYLAHALDAAMVRTGSGSEHRDAGNVGTW